VVRSFVTALLLACAVSGVAHAADPVVVTGTIALEPARVVVDLTIAPGWHVNANHPTDEFLVPTALDLAPPPGVTVGAVEYPTPVERVLSFSAGKPMRLYEGQVRLTASRQGEPAPDGPALVARLRYQACDDTRCLPPRTLELTAAAPAAPPASPGSGAALDDNPIARWIARWGWSGTLVIVALIGVTLNLTPCVYPLIGVTVAFFGGRTGHDAGRAVRHALVYVLGICLSFSTLGVAAALTGSLFGAALQRPVVLGALAALMAALALANFGLYTIRVPPGVMQFAGRAGEGAAGALFMGSTMGIVAAPCIGPVVAWMLLYVGARQSAPLGFALFFALGVGLGAPYVALASAAGRLRRLPKSGPWLEWVERALGFMLLGAALHFATPLLPAWLVRAAWAGLLAAAGVVLGFLGGTGRGALVWPRRLAGAVALLLALDVLTGGESVAPIAWVPFSDGALATASKSCRPVLIDFMAEWCLPCREMDHTTFRDRAVVDAAAGFTMLRADVTAQDDRATELLERFHIPGVPTLVLLGPDGRERRRLVGYVAPGDMSDALRSTSADRAQCG
jgi:thiol:disulfide interchange protein DsbD